VKILSSYFQVIGFIEAANYLPICMKEWSFLKFPTSSPVFFCRHRKKFLREDLTVIGYRLIIEISQYLVGVSQPGVSDP
jgi:hypothetical protein